MLDGEDHEAPPFVTRHLDSCAGCRQWQAEWAALARRFRVSGAASVPDLREPIVAAVLADVRARRSRKQLPARLALAAVAVAQLVLAVPVLLLGHEHEAPQHVAHEIGSFDVALGLGLIAAALAPALARGMLPVIGATVALLGLTAILDVAGGRTGLADELPHVLTMCGFLLLCSLAGVWRRPGLPPGHWSGVHRRPRRRAASARQIAVAEVVALPALGRPAVGARAVADGGDVATVAAKAAAR